MYKHAIHLIKKRLRLCTLIHKFSFLYTLKYISYKLGKLRVKQILLGFATEHQCAIQCV